MSQKKKTLVSGVAILGIAGILSKVIGMFFRIPLTNMIGAGGMGIYTAVYQAYTLLLTISTAGIPVAISRLVSENVTLGKYRQARHILRTALWLLLAVGLVLSLLLIAVARPLSVATGDAETTLGYMAIAPSILIVSLMSAIRGYMQGRSRMLPTAISQVIEQLGKVAISFPLAALGMRTHGVVYAAAGALLGISIGEGVALLYMTVVYFRRKREFIADEQGDTHALMPTKEIVRQLIVIAIPIIIGSMIVPVAGTVDSAMIRLRLIAAGFDEVLARETYGLLGSVISLINIPTVLATAVCISLVPIISAARIEKRYESMHETSRLGLRLASLIGFPCAVGMSLLSRQIIMLLYPKLLPEQIVVAGNILSISAWSIILFTHVQATTGILQGAGMQKVPMYSLVIGVLFKVVLNYTLVAIPWLNIKGAPIASIVCYGVSFAINIGWIVKKTGMRINWGDILVRPGLATLGMGGGVALAMMVLDMSKRRSTILAVLAGVLVYVVLVFAFGALRREDMEQIPGGNKLEKLLVKLHIWRQTEGE